VKEYTIVEVMRACAEMKEAEDKRVQEIQIEHERGAALRTFCKAAVTQLYPHLEKVFINGKAIELEKRILAADREIL
jgi:hypothetical protein